MTNKARILEILAGVTYAAEFVPQSKSRNAGERPSLNWRVTLARGNRKIDTDYMQGIGHLPGFKYPGLQTSIAADQYQRECAETGKHAPAATSRAADPGFMRAKIPAPDILDVAYCLVSDSSVLDYPRFEEWAAEYGYEEDSRAAEKSYRECIALALELRAMLGDATLAQLRELFSDY